MKSSGTVNSIRLNRFQKTSYTKMPFFALNLVKYHLKNPSIKMLNKLSYLYESCAKNVSKM